MSEPSPNRSRSPAPPPPAQPRRSGPPPPPRNGATSPQPILGQPARSPLQPIATGALPNRTRQAPGIPGSPPPISGSGALNRSNSNSTKLDIRPMSPISAGPKLEPSATEGRWTFKSSSDFPIPPLSDNSKGRVYPSGNSSGTCMLLKKRRFTVLRLEDADIKLTFPFVN
ncbi:hypothetical protein BGZ46_003291 [Entomortierella lignicola]|nr:hypothetical protein BGZ46_003291 [Entomortierella lignicola]